MSAAKETRTGKSTTGSGRLTAALAAVQPAESTTASGEERAPAVDVAAAEPPAPPPIPTTGPAIAQDASGALRPGDAVEPLAPPPPTLSLQVTAPVPAQATAQATARSRQPPEGAVLPLTDGSGPASSLQPVDRRSGEAAGSELDMPAVGPVHDTADPAARENAATRRAAKRRPAGHVSTAAANDDSPSIGGLIYSLQQKPSNRPFTVAAIATAVWLPTALLLGAVTLAPDWSPAAGIADFLARPAVLAIAATTLIPVVLFWFLAQLVWRAQELRLMSSAMSEVAIRLAEPDRMAEQSIASLGQAVRRQVTFMNEGVSRALGRASELEAIVHNEVAALDRSYRENEHKIKGLIEELAGERHALVGTGDRMSETLRTLGHEMPEIIAKLESQQRRLASVIEEAGQNLIQLEGSVANTTDSLQQTLDSRTDRLQTVLGEYSEAVGSALGSRTVQLQEVFAQYTELMREDVDRQAEQLQDMLESQSGGLERALIAQSSSLERTLGVHGELIKSALEDGAERMEGVLGERTDQMRGVIEQYTSGLDEALGHRTERIEQAFSDHEHALDSQLVLRTRALEQAFTERLQSLDESIQRSTSMIDRTVGEKAAALTRALESHAVQLTEALTRQSAQFDQAVLQGVSDVHRTSEKITLQTVKAIDSISGQADMLRNVSENILSQISGVTGRFENQSQTMLKAANSLETANYRIDSMLQTRHHELSETLDRLSSKAGDFDRVLLGYSTTVEGSLNEAEAKARALTLQLTQGAKSSSEQALAELDRLKSTTGVETERALEELRSRVTSVSREVSEHMGSLSNRFTDTSEEMRRRAQKAADEIAEEQRRIHQQLEHLPNATRQTARAMREALSEQLRAIDRLSSMTSREQRQLDVTPPIQAASSAAPQPQVTHGHLQPSAGGLDTPISAIADGIAHRMASRGSGQPAGSAGVQHSAAAAGAPVRSGNDPWSLGDLLARASREDAASDRGFSIDNIARSIDATTAGAIWARLRAGQRGIMVRSIYTPEGRHVFDEVSRRYRSEGAMRSLVDRYLTEFDRLMTESEQRDPTGQLLDSHLVSDSGRVYLFLSHATGRLG